VIRFLDLYYDDTDILEGIGATLTRYEGWNNVNSSSNDIVSVSSPPLGAPGKSYASSEFISHSVNNNVRYGRWRAVRGRHILFVELGPGLPRRGHLVAPAGQPGARQRQLRRRPDGPSLLPLHRGARRSGITVGCGSGDYCPSSFITRGEMAVFLAKALGLQWQALGGTFRSARHP
jgi:hypothetical protein